MLIVIQTMSFNIFPFFSNAKIKFQSKALFREDVTQKFRAIQGTLGINPGESRKKMLFMKIASEIHGMYFLKTYIMTLFVTHTKTIHVGLFMSHMVHVMGMI